MSFSYSFLGIAAAVFVGNFVRGLKWHFFKFKRAGKKTLIFGLCGAALLAGAVSLDVLGGNISAVGGDAFACVFAAVTVYISVASTREKYEMMERVKSAPGVKKYNIIYYVFIGVYFAAPIIAATVYIGVTGEQRDIIINEAMGLGASIISILAYFALFVVGTVFLTKPYRKAYLEERAKLAEKLTRLHGYPDEDGNTDAKVKFFDICGDAYDGVCGNCGAAENVPDEDGKNDGM